MAEQDFTGSRARARRLELGLKQADVARKAGISPAYLNLIEHNRRRINRDLLGILAEVLALSPKALSEGAALPVVEGILDAADGAGTSIDLTDAQGFAERYPNIADLILKQQARIKGIETTLDSLSDRLSHDPFYADTLHEIISAVSSIQATSSILMDAEGMDAQLERRFRANIHADSQRLAGATQGLSDFLTLDQNNDAGGEALSPHDEVSRILERSGFHHPALETGTTGVPQMATELFAQASPAAMFIGRKYLEVYQRLARLLPLRDMQTAIDRHGYNPDPLARALDVSHAVLFRRLAALPAGSQSVGLIVVDGSGRLLHRQTCDGFDAPRGGAACALWPVFRALNVPQMAHRVPITQIRRAAAGAKRDRPIMTYATAEPVGTPDFERPQVYQAVMLLLPDTSFADRPTRVGTACRVCQHATCVARGEPSILSDGL